MILKLGVVIFFVWSAIDRIVWMYRAGRSKLNRVTIVGRLHSVIMIFIYGSVALVGFHSSLVSKVPTNIAMACLGIILFLVARTLRIAAFDVLGSQWNVHTSANISRIMTIGPYKYTRHPYYSATFLELIAYATLFVSLNTLVLTLFVFLPMILHRVYLEEKYLQEKFPKAYKSYSINVGVMFSFSEYISDHLPVSDLQQLLSIVRLFGLKQLSKIRFMSDSVMKYSRGYAVSRISGAMIEVGFIEELIRFNNVHLVKFAKEKNLDFSTLKTICDYFVVLGIFRKDKLNYSLSSYGRKLFDISRGAFTLLYAYMPVFEALPEILRKEKKYGVDIFRKSEYVGRGSAELAHLLPFPFAKDILSRHNLHKILDLGCGAGDFLISFCKDNGFYGYGVDLSPEVIAVARKNAKMQDVVSQVKFETGDLRYLNRLSGEFKNIDVITAMFVLHEYLEDGDSEVVDILKKIKSAFPNKYVLISEVCRWNLKKLVSHPVPVAEHHLFHRLSHQGLATVKEWKAIFKKAGYRCAEERRFDRAAQSYFLLTPGN